MQRNNPDPWWTSPRLRWLLWFTWLTLATAALIGPSLAKFLRRQLDAGENDELDQSIFLLSKAFHIGAYALLAVLTAWLPAPRRLRVLLLLLLSAHAAGTEVVQLFVTTRSGTLHDVAFNHAGLLLGLALTWKWWLRPTPPLAVSREAIVS